MSTQASHSAAGDPAPSAGELVSRMTQEISTLVRDEIRMAQLEVTSKAKKTGAGLGLFGGAGVFAWFGFGALVAAAILGLAHAVPSWLAAVIVGVVLMVVAGIAALLGRKEVAQATPPVPEETISSVKTDVRAVKQAVKR